MKVEVSLCGVLRYREKGARSPAGEPGAGCAGEESLAGEGEMELAEGATLQDVAARLGLDKELGWVAFVNGKPAASPSPLNDGDEVYLFLPVSGG